MRSLKFAVIAACLAALAAPAGAQSGMNQGSSGAAFVAAVRKQNNNDAMKILEDIGDSVVNRRDYNDDTALIAAINNNDDTWVGFLLRKGADPNLSGRGGDTPLIAAARIGYDDAVNWLLQLGAKVDQANKMGETPLIIAVQQRQTRIVRRLLDAGANPDKSDSAAGLSARDYATRDTRSREFINMIEAKKPKKAAAAR